jgi:hypothetical protein
VNLRARQVLKKFPVINNNNEDIYFGKEGKVVPALN